MSLFTSTHFASACASGTDWRDTAKNVLEKLDDIRTEHDDFNFGFLYISDHLAEDATSIFNLFKSVLKIDDWVGSVGMGVLGCRASHVDQPAISAMIGRFPKESFCVFPTDPDDAPQDKVMRWLGAHTPMLAVVHGDPLSEQDPQETLRSLEEMSDSFVVGGLTSSRKGHYQIANAIYDNNISGVFFADNIPVSTTLSQGCQPIAPAHVITKVDENVVLELDDKPALEVLEADLRAHYAQKTSQDISSLLIGLSGVEASDQIPAEFKTLFEGHIHAAFPFSQSDQTDYTVRSITGIYADERSLSVAEPVEVGRAMLFVERDEESVSADLSKTLVQLRARVVADRGVFEPKGALYISCVARGFTQGNAADRSEIDLINEIIGTIPMAGFYAGGEINNARLYGFTGVMILFF